MKRIALLTAVVAAAFTTATAVASISTATRSDPRISALIAARLFPPPIAPAYVESTRSKVWDCQRSAGLPHSRSELRHRELAAVGRGYRGWILNQWSARLDACERVLTRTLPETGDWMTAIAVVQRAFPNSGWWLSACSTSEGGHGGWVPNSSGSGAGGWMQYMLGTFVHDFNRALADATARGFRIPQSARSWYSPLGQALAGGWAYSHDRPSGKWTGGSC